MYKEKIDHFVTKNFNFLIECSTNILKSKKNDPNDLVAELVLFLYESPEKLEPYMDIEGDGLLAFSLSWMKLQSKWKTTPFNRLYSVNNEGSIPDSKIKEVEAIEDDPLEDPDIKDMKTIWTDEQIEKILSVRRIYENLSKSNQILFTAYFDEGLSYQKIKENYTFFKRSGKKIIYYKSKGSIYTLMTKLKQDIWKQL